MQSNLNNKTNVKTIGITGGSGVGKSKICSILIEHGAVIIDADVIAHSIIKKNKPAYNEILDYFGTEILTSENEIDRKKLGAIVFVDVKKLEFLTKTTHKYIIAEMKSQIQKYKSDNLYKYIVLDAPLLIEANLHNEVDTVWVVYATLETRIKRLESRDNLTREHILQRINKQTPFEVTKKFANLIIENEDNSDLKQLEQQILKSLKNI